MRNCLKVHSTISYSHSHHVAREVFNEIHESCIYLGTMSFIFLQKPKFQEGEELESQEINNSKRQFRHEERSKR